MADQITDEMVEAAERAYMSAQTDLPYHECERCGGSGAVGESRCPDCGGVGIIVEFPEGWNPMRAALEAAARERFEPVTRKE